MFTSPHLLPAQHLPSIPQTPRPPTLPLSPDLAPRRLPQRPLLRQRLPQRFPEIHSVLIALAAPAADVPFLRENGSVTQVDALEMHPADALPELERIEIPKVHRIVAQRAAVVLDSGLGAGFDFFVLPSDVVDALGSQLNVGAEKRKNVLILKQVF